MFFVVRLRYVLFVVRLKYVLFFAHFFLKSAEIQQVRGLGGRLRLP